MMTLTTERIAGWSLKMLLLIDNPRVAAALANAETRTKNARRYDLADWPDQLLFTDLAWCIYSLVLVMRNLRSMHVDTVRLEPEAFQAEYGHELAHIEEYILPKLIEPEKLAHFVAQLVAEQPQLLSLERNVVATMTAAEDYVFSLIPRAQAHLAHLLRFGVCELAIREADSLTSLVRDLDWDQRARTDQTAWLKCVQEMDG